MNRSERMAEIFAAVVDLPVAEGDAVLAAECHGDDALEREVRLLLEADRALATPATIAPDAPERRDGEPPGGAAVPASGADLGGFLRPWIPRHDPAFAGRYRILRVLGEGGMGVVYEAEQDRPRRRVALKLIRSSRPTEELRRRFENEAEMLGRLQHPGIAQIYDLGVDELGQPFFAMERVDGPPLLDYAGRNALGTRARLELVAAICDAVEHAHVQGVIHRDLKPANILVQDHDGKPQPKILDFGVARAADSETGAEDGLTRTDQILGTLSHMSPEQLIGRSGDIDRRADIYALGVILYELLGGTLPLEVRGASLVDWVRAVTESEPTRLGALGSQFRGDIETIVHKCLEKDRSRRYASAADLAQDIRLHLRNEPIRARPPSAIYRMAKFTRRHRALVAGTAAALFALLAGTIVSTTLYIRSQANLVRARTAEEAAREEAATSTRVVDFLIGLFEVADPGANRGETITVREVLDAGAGRIRDELADEPAVRANLMLAIGKVYESLGLFASARPLFEDALATRRNLYGPESLEAAEAERSLAYVLLQAAEYASSRQLYEHVLGVRKGLLDPNDPDLAESLSDLGSLALETGDPTAAESLLVGAVAIQRQNDDAEQLGFGLHNYAGVLRSLGRLEEAEAHYAEAYDLFVTHFGEQHPHPVSSLSALGLTRRDLGRLAEAEADLRRALTVGESLFGRESPVLSPYLNNLALVLADEKKLAESDSIYARLAGLDRREFGAEHPYYAGTLANWAGVKHDRGDLAQAEALYRQALAVQERVYGNDDWRPLQTTNNLASVLEAQGDLGRAAALYERVVARAWQREGESRRPALSARSNLGSLEVRRGRRELGLAHLQAATEAEIAVHGAEHPRVLTNERKLAKAYEALGRHEEAEAAFRRSYEGRKETLGPGDGRTLGTGVDLARVLQVRGKAEEAFRLVSEARAGFEADGTEETPTRGDSAFPDELIEALVLEHDLLRALGRVDEAIERAGRLERMGRASALTSGG